MTRLQDLYRNQDQSPWLDNLKRQWLSGGQLARWVERGVRGITSNPTTFQKAIVDSAEYDDQFKALVDRGASLDETYWALVIQDIRGALALLRPAHDESDGVDGYVSLELAPSLAHDRDGSLASARDLHQRIDEPNLFVKIPGTPEGVEAFRQAIAAKLSINVTLLFSIDRHEDVMEAYLSGLEAAEGDLSGIASVASFFLSRVDTEVDRRLEEIGTPEALELRGRAAVAQAKVAYARFQEHFSGPRWEALVARGARVQRPLWASTSTKNPDYPDTLYVDPLVGPHTVNTMPEKTLDAFDDHGTVARTIDADQKAAWETLAAIRAVGVDLDDVGHVLEDQGVASFAKSFDGLMASLAAKAGDLAGKSP